MTSAIDGVDNAPGPGARLPGVIMIQAWTIKEGLGIDRMLESQSVDQAGFRPGYCCDHNLFAIGLMAEKMQEYHRPLWIVVVD